MQAQNYRAYSRQDLTNAGFSEDLSVTVSATTGIQYKFPAYLNAERTAIFVPIILSNEDGSFKKPAEWSFIQAFPVGADGKSDADRFIVATPGISKFPPYDDPASMNDVPGLNPANTKNSKFIIAPNWCTFGLFTLEAGVQVGGRQFTAILSDTLPIPSGKILVRDQAVLNGLIDVNFSDQNFQNTYGSRFDFDTAESKTASNQIAQLNTEYQILEPKIRANPNDTVSVARVEELKRQYAEISSKLAEYKKDSIPGQGILSLPELAASLLKAGRFTVKPDTTVQVIGRAGCIDLIHLFVVIPNAKVSSAIVEFSSESKQIATTAPHQPILQQQAATQTVSTYVPPAATTPSGFVPAPGATTTLVPGYNPYMQVASLPENIQRALERFLREESCGKKENKPRLPGLINKLREQAEKGYAQVTLGKYLNVSSCAYGAPTSKHKGRITHRMVPGSNYPLALSILETDLTRLIAPSSQNKLGKESDELINSLFSKMADIIDDSFGSTTSKPEEAAHSVSYDLLRRIPPGTVPTPKTHITVSSGFSIEPSPLADVTSISIPITDGKRCLPSLSAKKRGLNR